MRGEKILVVDDEKNIRDSLVMAFEEYDIVTATCAREALSILKKPNNIYLIVLDVMMPDFGGLQLLAEIKRINPEYKVIIMTGYSNKDTIIEALRKDADDYLEKPLDLKKTKEMFERLLAKTRNLPEIGVDATERKINFAKSLIERNYNKPLSLSDVSGEVFLNYKYFSRLFKEKTGKTFNEYRLGFRMEQAKQLLKEGGYEIAQVAYKIGYQNPDSFMKMFKRCTGTTPSQYRSGKKKKK